MLAEVSTPPVLPEEDGVGMASVSPEEVGVVRRVSVWSAAAVGRFSYRVFYL